MNCRRRMSAPRTTATPKGPSQKGNPVTKKGDKDGMERGPLHTVKLTPEWDGKARVIAEK